MSKFEEFPKLLYKKSADGQEFNGVKCLLRQVESAEEQSDASADGYHESPADAEKAAKAEQMAKARAAKPKATKAKKAAKPKAEAPKEAAAAPVKASGDGISQ